MLTDDVRLTDHHCHGVDTGDLDRPGFERLLGEGARGSFDSAIGLAVRRWCAPALDLPAHVGPDVYLRHRARLGGREVAARLLRASGVNRWFLDTGIGGGTADFAALVDGEVREVIRLEEVAEQVVAQVGAVSGVYERIEAELRARAAGAVGLKTIVAYRYGLDFPLRDHPPTSFAPEHRLTDPDVLGWLVGLGARIGAELGLPLQFHTGFGDPDLRLRHGDPLLLTDFLRRTAGTGLSVMLLHCWPFHRHAAYLAHVFEHVHLDLGLTIPYVGQRAGAVLAETLELAPFRALCYSSDGYGLPELHYLGALLWRRGLGKLVDEWLADDAITTADAEALVGAFGHGNAERVYPARFSRTVG
ncbi:amidohydrolase family protein [Nocardia sp. CDC186]|uniref:Amidohydrolase family protein n=1 Tax=Nocardia implantans TaxID=3108168 RepID=A0ABU6AQ90_9NOCA|nr:MULTISPECIES: amidohydrolase family protein [unclassified Nocardia]MBF6189870.1 amidohydrolase family protein [Nocardia beijingensis]MEA3526895.1 amidohydrolase family protein [Nocardia sp. CDC192]MEB3509527.1 amidohydrolase family protein [Nocardia sp. CDC186]